MFNTDVGSFDLGQRRYDLATCMGSLHHVAELDDVLQATSRSRAPNGVLVAYEYVVRIVSRQARSSDASPSSSTGPSIRDSNHPTRSFLCLIPRR